MKLKIYIITTLFFLISATFSQSVFAQLAKSPPKVLTQDELDKREVNKFTKSFVESFLQIQDVKKMPERFFAKTFKTNFSNSNFDIYADEFKKFSSDKISSYNRNALFANFFGLLTAVASLKKINKDDDNSNFKKLLPPELVSKFRKVKWLKAIIDDDTSAYTENDVENENDLSEESTRKMLVEIEKDTLKISMQMRKYLSKSLKQRSKYLDVNLQTQFEYYPADLCKGEDCFGLPENTPIFSAHQLLMCLRIARINGQFKIIQIYSEAMES